MSAARNGAANGAAAGLGADPFTPSEPPTAAGKAEGELQAEWEFDGLSEGERETWLGRREDFEARYLTPGASRPGVGIVATSDPRLPRGA